MYICGFPKAVLSELKSARAVLQSRQIFRFCLPCFYIGNMLLLGCKSGYTELGPYAVRNNLRSIRLKCLLVTERFKLLNNICVMLMLKIVGEVFSYLLGAKHLLLTDLL